MLAVQFAPGVPVSFGTATHDILPLVALREPWLGPVTTLKLRVVLSRSAAVSVIGLATSSLVETLWAPAVGASFTGDTVSETTAGMLSRLPSLTLKLKLSGPL